MKTKKAHIHPFTELHFISNLPLDRSSELISCVAYPHPLVLNEVNPNTINLIFSMNMAQSKGRCNAGKGMKPVLIVLVMSSVLYKITIRIALQPI